MPAWGGLILLIGHTNVIKKFRKLDIAAVALLYLAKIKLEFWRVVLWDFKAHWPGEKNKGC